MGISCSQDAPHNGDVSCGDAQSMDDNNNDDNNSSLIACSGGGSDFLNPLDRRSRRTTATTTTTSTTLDDDGRSLPVECVAPLGRGPPHTWGPPDDDVDRRRRVGGEEPLRTHHGGGGGGGGNRTSHDDFPLPQVAAADAESLQNYSIGSSQQRGGGGGRGDEAQYSRKSSCGTAVMNVSQPFALHLLSSGGGSAVPNWIKSYQRLFPPAASDHAGSMTTASDCGGKIGHSPRNDPHPSDGSANVQLPDGPVPVREESLPVLDDAVRGAATPSQQPQRPLSLRRRIRHPHPPPPHHIHHAASPHRHIVRPAPLQACGEVGRGFTSIASSSSPFRLVSSPASSVFTPATPTMHRSQRTTIGDGTARTMKQHRSDSLLSSPMGSQAGWGDSESDHLRELPIQFSLATFKPTE